MFFVLKSKNRFYQDAGQKETCHVCGGFKDHVHYLKQLFSIQPGFSPNNPFKKDSRI